MLVLASAVLTIHVLINNLAGIPAAKVLQYFQDVSAVFLPIQIDAEMLNPSAPPDPQGFYIVLSDKTLPKNFYGAIGAANPQARVAWIFMPEISQMAGNHDRLTELAIAHELGHLLGLWHTVTGIMAPAEYNDSPESNLRALDKSQVRFIEKKWQSSLQASR